ncbi:MAG: hypothetical protein WBM02_10970 [bacterium]
MSNKGIDGSILNGTWKLEYFETPEGVRFTHFSDILLFAYPYYSDFHAEFGLTNLTFSHVGMVKVSGNNITFQVQLSTEPSYINLTAVGTYSIGDGFLEIIMERGNTPGKWAYRKLT